MRARNTLVHLLAAYTNPESHNAQRHRQTDGQQDYANSRSYCVAVRSAKKSFRTFPQPPLAKKNAAEDIIGAADLYSCYDVC